MLRADLTLPASLSLKGEGERACSAQTSPSRPPSPSREREDFYCAALRLVVEIDGAVHDDVEWAERDARRTTILARRGLRVVRLENDRLNRETCERRFSRSHAPSPFSERGTGGEVCAGAPPPPRNLFAREARRVGAPSLERMPYPIGIATGRLRSARAADKKKPADRVTIGGPSPPPPSSGHAARLSGPRSSPSFAARRTARSGVGGGTVAVRFGDLRVARPRRIS